MTIISAVGLFAPIVLVIFMMTIPNFDGWKTNTQLTLMGVLGLLQSADLSFIPDEMSAPLILGASIAGLIGKKMSNKTPSVGNDWGG